MSKKKKIAAFIIIFMFLLVGTVFLLNFTNYSFVKSRAVNYLCDKYDADKDEFELVDYKPSKIYIGSSGEIEQHLAFSDFSFEFKYKDKNFFVNRYKGKFYDDYQIDDIEKWCTEWLQKNVDPEIVGVEIFSDVIYHSSENRLPSCNLGDTKTVFTKNDAEEILKAQKEVFSYYAIFYKVDDINDYGTIKHSELHGFGNQNYISFRIRKESKLNKKTVTQGSNVVIIQNIQFSRTPNTIEYTSYQNYYSLDRSIKYIWS